MKLWFIFSAIETRNIATTTTAEPTTTLIVTTHGATTNDHASDMTTTTVPLTNTMKTRTLDYTTVFHHSTVAMWNTDTTTWFHSQ